MATAIDPICKMEVDTDNPPGGQHRVEEPPYHPHHQAKPVLGLFLQRAADTGGRRGALSGVQRRGRRAGQPGVFLRDPGVPQPGAGGPGDGF